MILGLPAVLHDAKISVDIAGRISHYLEILGGADVIGAAAADQDSARPQHLERAQVELFVTAEGGFEIALALGEGGRIEHDGVVAAAGVGVVPQEVKGIGFNPFDVAAVQRGVAVRDLERGTGTVHTSDLGAGLGEVQGDATQIQQALMNLCVNARDAMPDGGTLTLTADNVTLDDVREINRAMRADLWAALEAGKLTMPIDRTFPLDKAADALAVMRANAHFGKIVLTMD
jgi:signal transduction histidine kinase